MTTDIQLPAVFKSNLPEPKEIGKKIKDEFSTIYTKLEAEIDALDVDLSTKKGRDEIASLAYKISRTKTGLDGAAKNLTEEQKAVIDAVNAERKQMRETLDGLRDKVRDPLTKWETDERARIAKIESALACLRDLGRVDAMCDPEQIRNVMSSDKLLFSETLWGEYEAQAEIAYQAAKERREADLVAAEKRVAEEKELAELRALKAEQERKAAEAAAEEARKAAEEAEKAAQAERQRKAEEAAKAAAEAEIAAAAERARQAEEAAKQAEEAAKAAAEQAERDKAEAVRAEAARVKREQEQAAAAAKAAEEARAADLAHRKKINNDALKALIKCSEITEDQAKMIVQAIAKGQIPHVKISY